MTKALGLKARVDAQRAEAGRLRAAGLTVAVIGERLGLSKQRASQLLRLLPPNYCRTCGGPIERQKRYHVRCRPSHREPSGRPTGPQPTALPTKRYGFWKVLGYAAGGKWLCRCRCGVERAVGGSALKTGKSGGCRSCAAKARWAKKGQASGG